MNLFKSFRTFSLVQIGWHYTGCLKIDATHKYDNILLPRQAQQWSFETRPGKKCILWAREIKSNF